MYCIKANQECEENWLFNVLNHFPIPIEVFNSEGLCVFINKEFIEFFCVSDPSMIVGKTKIIHDVIINEKMSTSEYLNRVFSGNPFLLMMYGSLLMPLQTVVAVLKSTRIMIYIRRL